MKSKGCFIRNTDTVDIDARCLGISPSPAFEARGLHIQIRHNRTDLFGFASEMQAVILRALNQAIESGELVFPDTGETSE